MMNKLFYFLSILTLVLSACEQKQALTTLQGHTMGTTWSVKLKLNKNHDEKALTLGIQKVLDGVNNAMSTYQKDSELSLFNAIPDPTCIEASPQLRKVVQAGLHIHKQSGGAFDATVGPLVDIWGFGPTPKVEHTPNPALIKKMRATIGSEHIKLNGHQLCKELGQIHLDLSAIAKGFGVDEVNTYLQSQGINNALVEVGGELYASGYKQANKAWSVAVETPKAGARSVFETSILNVTNVGIATSGDYRNYFEENGVRYSHTINPKTGYPITHNLASVTVIANNTMEADGWATAMTVLGKDKGMALANQLGLKVFMITREKDGFKTAQSDAFKAFQNKTK